MAVTLMALYRRPEGGEEALQTFQRRYFEEHLPLVRETPGLRSLRVENVAQAFGETDLVFIARMEFDDRAALDAGLASDAMRRAGRNLREIAPGLSTVLVMEEDTAMSWEGQAGGGSSGGADTSAAGATEGGGEVESRAPAEGARDDEDAAEVSADLGSTGDEPAEGRVDADQ